MASVTSLDKDMRKLRLDRYTPQAANEVRAFIEESLGERLAPGDLMDALKDGVTLCKLVNLAVPHPIRYKQKAVMPFVQMENISIFLDACKQPPLNLQNHDIFLTVDLYESKDPAQVLQCLGAFSRIAHQLQPSHFPSPVGGKSKSGIMSPQGTGGGYNRARGASNASNNSSSFNPSSSSYNSARPPSAMNAMRTGESNGGRWSPTKSPGPVSPGGGVSSWSKKSDEGATSPAWNIAQYGYMGGASQGNLGVSFGGRRQITSAGPYVPNMAEKEKKRKEKEAEEERMRIQQQEEEQRRLEEQQAEEERARLEEERRWAEETRKLRDQEKRKAEEERRRWEEEERQWKLDEEQRQREEREAEARLEEERKKIGRGRSGSQLQGQYLSQYQAENGVSSESSRIKELERELERARERERQYERERLAKVNGRKAVEDHDMNNRLRDEAASKARARSRSRPRLPSRKNSDEEWRKDEREYLRQQHKTHHANDTQQSRPLPEPQSPVRLVKPNTGPSSRPLPDPATYAASLKPNPTPKYSPGQSRTERYLSSNPAPQQAQPKTTYSSEIGGFDSAAERDAEDRRRIASQKQTKAGGWASKSLLEREMEMERQRQQEWEESQKETKSKAVTGNGVDGIGGGIGGKWDVNQWTGYTGGDGQNRGTQGIGSGRRQIVGPRPPPPGR